jgi:uncharacterized protein YllA (UPF0747 family)
MPDGTPSRGSNVSWRDYVDLRIEALERAIEEAKRLMESRLAKENGIRDDMEKMSHKFLLTDIYEARHQRIEDAIDELRLFKAALDAKASQITAWAGCLLALIALLLSVWDHIAHGVMK